MSFAKSLAAIDSHEFEEQLLAETRIFISCLNVCVLTRCGGHASDPKFSSLLKTTHDEKTLTIMVAIEFSDGDALDCSGHCGGNVVQRRDTLVIEIDRATGKSHANHADGLLRNCPEIVS